MYTEEKDVDISDDEQFSYSNDYNFDNNFNNNSNNDNKNKKNKKDRNKEIDYQFSYDGLNENTYEETDDYEETPRDNKDTTKWIIIIGILVIVLAVAILLLFKGCAKSTRNQVGTNSIITLDANEVNLEIKDKKTMKATLSSGEEASVNWVSDDESIATVSEDGVITAKKNGKTTITAIYFDKDGNSYEIGCNVTVGKTDNSSTQNTDSSSKKSTESKDDTTKNIEVVKPKLNLSSSVSSDKWSNGDVTISIDSDSKASIKYAFDCTSKCNYSKLTNSKKIVVSKDGTTVVTVVATIDDVSTTKTINVKVDKTKPSLSIPKEKYYSNKSSFEVCLDCSDKESGCKSSKACKTFTASVNDASVVGVDNAGNKVTSDAFSVIIDKTNPTCKIVLSNSDMLTATPNDNVGLAYYGFSSNYSGSNETQKKVTAANTYTYYVKDLAGNVNTCKIKIVANNASTCDEEYKIDTAISPKCSKYIADAIIKNGNWGSPVYRYVAGSKNVDNCARAGDNWTLCTINTVKSPSECVAEGFSDGKCYLEATKTRGNSMVCSDATNTMVNNKCYSIKDVKTVGGFVEGK